MKSRSAWGFVFAGIFGTLLHFLYDWTGGAPAAALFSAVNESIWEHIKLLFYPWCLFQLLFCRKGSRFRWSGLTGLLSGLLLIPVLYYTYTGALGLSADWFNIAIFFLAAGVVFVLEARLSSRDFGCRLPRWPVWVILALLAVLFTVFTFFPPHIPLFRDPNTGHFGR